MPFDPVALLVGLLAMPVGPTVVALVAIVLGIRLVRRVA
jgi:hypothetical protein